MSSKDHQPSKQEKFELWVRGQIDEMHEVIRNMALAFDKKLEENKNARGTSTTSTGASRATKRKTSGK